MDTLYRHWLILRMIPRRRKISTREIHDRLATEYSIETTLRTIQRDLVNLQASQFPLECDEQTPPGWSWRKEAPTFDIPNMDLVTALTFMLAEKHLSRMLPKGTLEVLQPYFRAAGERLTQTNESHLSTWPSKVRVVSRNIETIPPKVTEVVSETVYNSLLNETRFKASYRKVGGEIKELEVSPLGLAFVDGQTYLIATQFEYENPTLLLLHRIVSAESLDKKVNVPVDFDLDDYIAEELTFPIGGDIRLKAAFSNHDDVQRIEESPISEDQKFTEQSDGRHVLSATVADSHQLRWWLHGYGGRVEVLGPKKLRVEFVELARTFSIIYQ